MKTLLKLFTFLSITVLLSCGGKEDKKKDSSSESNTPKTETATPAPAAKTETAAKTEEVKPSKRVDLTTKGVGPIKSVTLASTIDQDMAAKGAEVFKNMCTACHRTDKKFIGPAPTGILERRTPEWVMNMILNPEGMVKEDPLARELLIEFNGSPMANQNLTEAEARSVLEYFRTL